MADNEVANRGVGLSDEVGAQMTIPELKAKLREKRLRLSSRKWELLQRLTAALRLKWEHGARDDKEDNDDNNEDEDEEEKEEPPRYPGRCRGWPGGESSRQRRS